jgi:hypothetical protein
LQRSVMPSTTSKRRLRNRLLDDRHPGEHRLPGDCARRVRCLALLARAFSVCFWATVFWRVPSGLRPQANILRRTLRSIPGAHNNLRFVSPIPRFPARDPYVRGRTFRREARVVRLEKCSHDATGRHSPACNEIDTCPSNQKGRSLPRRLHRPQDALPCRVYVPEL